MGKVKYFFKNITLLNILLLSAIIFMVTYTLLPFLNMKIRYTLPAQKKVLAGEEAKQVEFSPPSPSDYTIIADENLFHPERRISPEKKVEPELPKPDFVLYGTMVSDDLKVAYLEDLKAPRTTPGRGKRQNAVKKGDMFSGFMLKEVEADKIVMVRGEEKMIVHIIDPQKPKTREAPVSVSQQAPALPAQTPQKGKPTTTPSQRATVSPQSATPQKEKPMPRPPRSSFESSVVDFFDKAGK